MEAAINTKRASLDGSAYNHLFPSVSGKNETIKKYADLNDTVQFIPKAVQATLYHTAQLAPVLKGATLRHTCSKVWHFLYGHTKYLKDEEGKEQIRSPGRSWRDRQLGIDCDCFSVFVSSILTNLGIPHKLRITKYPHSEGRFSHIYPIVPSGDGYITMDCVTDAFDYEAPYTEKKDVNMELQFLNGFGNSIEGSQRMDGLAELGRLLKKKGGKVSPFKPKAVKNVIRTQQQQKLAQRTSPNVTLPAVPGGYDVAKPKKKKFFGKLLNVVNKVNPATVLLRNGILASMKLNIRNLAARLRWSYLSPQQAAAKEIDPVKFQQLVAARMRLEKIFFGAGGKPANLRKAILGGKGNKDKAVNGLDGLEGYPCDISGMNEYTPMPVLLGATIYNDENNSGGIEGLGQLGEPVTLASIAAAAGVVAGIVGMIKELGNIFKKKEAKGADDFDPAANDAADKAAPTPTPAVIPPAATPPYINPDDGGGYTPAAAPAAAFIPPAETSYNTNMVKTGTENTRPPVAREEDAPGYESPATKETADPATTSAVENNAGKSNGGEPEKTSFWEKNKTWLKPVGIGLGTITVLGLAYAAMRTKGSTNNARQYERSNGSLAGLPGRKRNHQRGNAKKKLPKLRSIGLE